MAIATLQRTFYELCAKGVGGPVHCLIELEHPATAEPSICWLEASVQARKTLQRMPSPGELRQVTGRVAGKLAKSFGLTNCGQP
ncbi:MAG TPA: hypothetical protein VGD78_02955 [Chthoniobacterales bacterium]